MKKLIVFNSCMLFCCSAAVAALNVMDDFNDGVVNPGLWDAPLFIPGIVEAGFSETNGHLNFVSTSLDGIGIIPMKALVPFHQDWEITMTAVVPDYVNNSEQQYDIGLQLTPHSIDQVMSNRLAFAMSRDEANQKVFFENFVTNSVEVHDLTANRIGNTAKLRMRWLAAESNLYTDISTDGGTTWTNLWGPVINPFNMNSGDSFSGAIYAGSTGREIAISDNLYCDDFEVTLYSGPLGGSDDFNDNMRDTSKWIEAEPLLTETNNRLEFTTSGIGEENGNWTWVKNAGSYTDDWAVSVDVYNDANPSNQWSSIAMAIVGHNVSEGPLFIIGLASEIDQGHSIAGGWPDEYARYSTTNNAAQLRIYYDATAKTFTSSFDMGDGFTALTNRNIGSLVTGTNESFIVALTASSGYDYPIESGDMYFDNFEAVTLFISTEITNCYPVAEGFILEWIPVAGWDSAVKYSTNLLDTPFNNLSGNLQYPVNSYTDTVHGAEDECFYRVDVQME